VGKGRKRGEAEELRKKFHVDSIEGIYPNSVAHESFRERLISGEKAKEARDSRIAQLRSRRDFAKISKGWSALLLV